MFVLVLALVPRGPCTRLFMGSKGILAASAKPDIWRWVVSVGATHNGLLAGLVGCLRAWRRWHGRGLHLATTCASTAAAAAINAQCCPIP